MVSSFSNTLWADDTRDVPMIALPFRRAAACS